ncbi:hypothetical protein ACP4OV_031961 [Aristida adscensionis]
MEKSPELPQDILERVFATLEITDLVRAGSVCSSWHAAYDSLRSSRCRLQQTPCLLYTSAAAGASAVGLYSLTEKKAYTLPLPGPPICSRHIIGSSYGWIITADERSQLHLLNPITGEQIALPSLTTLEQVKPVLDDAGAVCNYEISWFAGEAVIGDMPFVFGLHDLRDYLYCKAFLSSDPCAGDYFVVLIHGPNSHISFARAGDDGWTWLPPHGCYQDCLFKGELLYASTLAGGIHEFDLGAPAVTPKIVLGDLEDVGGCDGIYIAQASNGDLLQIRKSYISPQGDFHDLYDSIIVSVLQLLDSYTSFKVHKVETASEEGLVEACSLGENVLFLGPSQSLCLRAEEHPQLKVNHVYFIDDDDDLKTLYKRDLLYLARKIIALRRWYPVSFGRTGQPLCG